MARIFNLILTTNQRMTRIFNLILTTNQRMTRISNRNTAKVAQTSQYVRLSFVVHPLHADKATLKREQRTYLHRICGWPLNRTQMTQIYMMNMIYILDPKVRASFE